MDPARHRRSSREDVAAAVAAADAVDPHCPGAELTRAAWLSPTLRHALEHYQEAASRALERIKLSAPKAWDVIQLAVMEEEAAEEENRQGKATTTSHPPTLPPPPSSSPSYSSSSSRPLPRALPPPLGYLWSEPRARPYLRACRGAAAALRAAGFTSQAATILGRITRVNGSDEQAAREELLGRGGVVYICSHSFIVHSCARARLTNKIKASPRYV